MSIDFFQEKCKTSSAKKRFGLCDEPPKPAYIDENNKEHWIANVENPDKIKVDCYAIDNCLVLEKEGKGNHAKRRDLLLKYLENKLIFIELKNRRGSVLKQGMEQLEETIVFFKKSYVAEKYAIKAHICNKRRPFVHQGQANKLEEFKEKTGIVLHFKNTITIPAKK